MSGNINLYVDEADVELLRERLNADAEIAFIIPEGPGRWRASWQVDDASGMTVLWHVPAGPLPLLTPLGQDTLVEDPFAGWQEREQGFYEYLPYFGPSEPRTLLLTLVYPGWRGLPRDWMPLSGVSWYGRTAARSPHPSTRRWWQRFRSFIRSHASLVTATNFESQTAWALPAAQRAIQAGTHADMRPFLLPSKSRRIHVPESQG